MSAKREQDRKNTSSKDRETSNPIQIQKFLGGLDYPVGKQDLIDRARKAGADEKVMAALERIPDQEYESPIALSRELGSR